MMGNFYAGMMGGYTSSLLGTLTWLALLAFLILGAVYFWKGINKK